MKTKSSQFLFLMIGIIMLSACHNDNRKGGNHESVVDTLEVATEGDQTIMATNLLVGSWKDSDAAALHFSLFENGTAQSDNMQTLLYKHWEVTGNQISFVMESIGNGTSFTDTVTYTIEELTEHRLLLRNGTQLSEYTKE